MTSEIPLEYLVLNLLSLAEMAGDLTIETREQLAKLANQAQADLNVLAQVSLNMRLLLRPYPAYRDAQARWGELAPGVMTSTLTQNLHI